MPTEAFSKPQGEFELISVLAEIVGMGIEKGKSFYYVDIVTVLWFLQLNIRPSFKSVITSIRPSKTISRMYYEQTPVRFNEKRAYCSATAPLCHNFESTGDPIALMLGRLRMTIDECIEAFGGKLTSFRNV